MMTFFEYIVNWLFNHDEWEYRDYLKNEWKQL